MKQQTLRFGQAWARLGPWRGGDHVAHLVVAAESPMHAAAILECVHQARAAGFTSVLTSAMGPDDEEAFTEAGFAVHERLHLLACDLGTEPLPPTRRVSRAGHRDRAAVLSLDAAAFAPFWRLGALGLRDALEATPICRFRATHAGHDLTGYAITGRAGNQGYLQRIAVHPRAQREGWGRALVADAMHWLWQAGVVRASVNTQLDNAPALALYESFGFRLLPGGLAVLGRTL